MPGRRPVSLRLFVAIDPPPETREALLHALKRDRDLSNARPTPAEQIHMTLQFIGDTDERQLDSVHESVERSASGLPPFDLHAQALIQLPERGRPRLIAAQTDAPPPLLELQRRLAHRLARNPRTNTGDRFRPHLTLCRYRKDGRAERFDAPVALDGIAFHVDRVRLMSSVLRPEGAEHREVAGWTLG